MNSGNPNNKSKYPREIEEEDEAKEAMIEIEETDSLDPKTAVERIRMLNKKSKFQIWLYYHLK